MTMGEVAAGIIIASAAIWCSIELYDLVQVKRGVFPKKADTSLEDIKKLRDSGHTNMAVRRFKNMPENKGLYTARGAAKRVGEL